MFKPKGEKI